MKTPLTLSLIFAASNLSLADEGEAIMESVRQVAVLQDSQDLHGAIRKGRNKTPLSMFLRGENIQFALNGGKEYFLLSLGLRCFLGPALGQFLFDFCCLPGCLDP